MENSVNTNLKDNIKIIGYIVIGLAIIFIGFLCYDKFFNMERPPVKDDSFVIDEDGAHGEVIITGYTVIHRETDCGDPTAICSSENIVGYNDIVNFYVISSDNENLQKEIDNWYGEGYTGEKPISLGCIENDIITYVNDADEFYNSETGYSKIFSLSKEDTSKIINSSTDNPVTLKLTKLKLTNGQGAPYCYTHFTYINVIDN